MDTQAARVVQLKDIKSMKAQLLVLFVCGVLCFLSFEYGRQQGQSSDLNTLRDVNATAARYLERFGSPTTKSAHCDFIYIVYADSEECKRGRSLIK